MDTAEDVLDGSSPREVGLLVAVEMMDWKGIVRVELKVALIGLSRVAKLRL